MVAIEHRIPRHRMADLHECFVDGGKPCETYIDGDTFPRVARLGK